MGFLHGYSVVLCMIFLGGGFTIGSENQNSYTDSIVMPSIQQLAQEIGDIIGFPRSWNNIVPNLNISFNESEIKSMSRQGLKDLKALNTENQCERDMIRVLKSLDESWAEQMLDSYAKIPFGVLSGKTIWIGDYNECFTSEAPPDLTNNSFSGKYCTILGLTKAMNLSVTMGICIPETCSESDLSVTSTFQTVIMSIYQTQNKESPLAQLMKIVRVSGVSCHMKSTEWGENVIKVLGIFCVVLVALGTATSIITGSVGQPENAGLQPEAGADVQLVENVDPLQPEAGADVQLVENVDPLLPEAGADLQLGENADPLQPQEDAVDQLGENADPLQLDADVHPGENVDLQPEVGADVQQDVGLQQDAGADIQLGENADAMQPEANADVQPDAVLQADEDVQRPEVHFRVIAALLVPVMYTVEAIRPLIFGIYNTLRNLTLRRDFAPVDQIDVQLNDVDEEPEPEVPDMPIAVDQEVNPPNIEDINPNLNLDEAVAEDMDAEIHMEPDVNRGILPVIKDVLKSFCIITNVSKLFNTENKENTVQCIHGIRFVCMAWIILAHTYTFSLASATTDNIYDVLQTMNNLFSQLIFRISYAADAFFAISGFLFTYRFLCNTKVTGTKVSWLIILQPFWRYTPLYAVVLALYMNVLGHLVSGPFSSPVLETGCSSSWWENLLYINNLNLFGTRDKAQCMGWTWFLSNETVFFLGTLITLLVFPRQKKWVIGLSSVFLFLVLALTLSLQSDNVPFFTKVIELQDAISYTQRTKDYFLNVFILPLSCLAPYLIGVIAGSYWFYTNFPNEERVPPVYSKIWVIPAWTFIVTGSTGVLYGSYFKLIDFMAVYPDIFNRILFASAICVLIMTCSAGYGSFVNRFLCHPTFVPLSRCTCSVYLIHPALMILYYVGLPQGIIMTYSVMIFHFLCFLGMSYVVAMVASLLFVSPVLTMEKLYGPILIVRPARNHENPN